MESLGNKLRTVRESKGYTIEYVSRETNIAGRYLAAMEAENFSGFPGEAYLLGFLRNYGEYLGLEADEVLSLYRALKIQEQPIPVEQLLKSPSSLPRLLPLFFLIPLILGLAGGGVYFFMKMFRRESAAAVPERQPVQYTMNTDSLERRFYKGDTILVPLDGDQYKLEISALGETVTVTVPSGPVILDLAQEVMIDLNNDGQKELRIIAMEFAKNENNSGIQLRLELENTIHEAPPAENPSAPTPQPGIASLPTAGNITIFTSPSSFPFTLQLAFQGYCMFRWQILFERDRRTRNEQYFQRSDELNIQAQNGIRIWTSNAQAAKAQIIGGGRTFSLEMGSAGEVVVADIRWTRDEDNRYRLIMTRLE